MNPVLQNLSRGALGMAFLIFVCYALSVNRSAINWKLVIFGVLAQVMFAMGVLHTTVGGQPVFWMLFAIVLLYTIVRKSRFAQANNTQPVFDSSGILVSAVWQVLFVVGLILAPQLFGTWADLAMTLSTITILCLRSESEPFIPNG